MDKRVDDPTVTKKIIYDMLQEMSEVFVNSPTFEKKKLDIWFKHLSHIKTRHVEMIVSEIVSEEKFFPVISVILSYNRRIAALYSETPQEIAAAKKQADEIRSRLGKPEDMHPMPITSFSQLMAAVNNPNEHKAIRMTSEEIEAEKERQLKMARDKGLI